jgi:glycosyltransferase involved in cell wall biosynthesis
MLSKPKPPISTAVPTWVGDGSVRHSEVQSSITSKPEDSSTFVSVIIPVYNDRERLKLCLDALEKQTYPQNLYEVIVVDNGSDERIEKIIDQFKQALVTSEEQRGSYAARNKGISLAKGEILAFTDSDCIPDKNWIEAGVKQLLSIPGCGSVAGKIEIFFEDPDKPTAVELYDSITYLQQKKYVRECNFGATANLFTFKKVFDEVGYFNDQLKSGGDMEWGQRVFSCGYPILYADDSYVRHPARKTLAELRQKVKRINKGHYEMSKHRNEDSHSTLIQFFISSLRLKPPLVSTLRKVLSEKRLKNNQQRVQVFCIELLVYYMAHLEKVKLQLMQLNDSSKRWSQ